MAAGLGFKDFVTGEVLTAADVDGYLMQGVWVFASAAARNAAVTSPQEGNFAYLKDTNVTTYYTGSAWANLDTTGMTNPMTTTGDTIYSSSGSTPARLGIGTAGQVLQVNSGATAPEWATPAGGGGMTLINTGGTTLTGASVTISSIPATYNNLFIVLRNARCVDDGGDPIVQINGDSTASRHVTLRSAFNGTASYNSTSWGLVNQMDNGASDSLICLTIPDYANATSWKIGSSFGVTNNPTTPTTAQYQQAMYAYNQTGAISSLKFIGDANGWTSGTVFVYGVK